MPEPMAANEERHAVRMPWIQSSRYGDRKITVRTKARVSKFISRSCATELTAMRPCHSRPGIDRVERSILPLAHLIEHCVGDPANEIGRHICAVELSQVALDLAHRHAARVEAQDFLIEPIEAGLAFGDQQRLEAAGPVARHRNLNLAVLSARGFPA